MPSGGSLLVVVATEAEVPSVSGAETLVCGVGKTAAAAATALRLLDGGVGAAVSFGVAGAYPGGGLAVGDVAVATEVAVVDEGLETGPSFEPFERADMPVPGAAWTATDPELRTHLFSPGAAEFTIVCGRVATVSVCAGTERLASERAASGAVAESMEGAAVAHAASCFDIPFVEVRGISNACGPRGGAPFELAVAVRNASVVLARLAEASV